MHPELGASTYIGRWLAANLLMVPIYDESGQLKYYENIAEPVGVGGEQQTMDVAFIDYDSDEDDDLIRANYDGSLRLYQNDSRLIELCP